MSMEIMDDKNGKTTPTLNRSRQYVASFAVSLGGFCAGTVLAWTSPASEHLIDQQTEQNNVSSTSEPPGFKISTTEEAVVAAMLTVGALIFAIPSGRLADIWGRKITLILLAVLYTINWILIGTARNVLTLVIARFFAGMGLGGSCVVCPMYVGEIAESSIRGVLGSMFNVLLCLGILYTSIIGTFASWIGLTAGLAVIPLAFGILVLFLPESPIHLINADKLGKARRALIYFRRDSEVASEELTFLQKKVSEYEDSSTLKELFTVKVYRRPLIAGIGVLAFQQFCGINVVVFNTVPIFRAAGSSIQPAIAAITTNFVSFVIGVVSIFVIERRDRKYFLTLSAFCMMLGVTSLGIFFQLYNFEIRHISLQFLPISGVMLFLAGFSIGLGPVPWILISELFTPEVRGIASGVVVLVNWLSAFIVTFTYPIIMRYIGTYLTFYLYGFINLLGILFIRFCVPETRV